MMLCLVALTACSPTAKSLAETEPQLRGRVVDEQGAAVVGVAVSLPGHAAQTVTDEAGSYALTVAKAKLGEESAVLLVHPSYARLTSRVRLSALQTAQNFTLRKHDLEQSVQLPDGNDAALVVPVSKADGGITLSIPAGSLALPDGTLASGAADLRLTYWHPNQAFATAPAPLVGTLGGNEAPVDLVSYGMADIELYQGTQKLQVVPGKTLALTFVQPPNLAAVLTASDANDAAAPHLWYADETTGLWSEVGSLTDGTLAVTTVAGATQVVAQLPHLSAWNLDGVAQTNACVTGKVVDSCGAPVTNRDVTLWLLSGGQVGQYTLTLGADGSFCGNLSGSAANDVKTGRTATFQYFVSALKDPNASVCNPTGAPSYSALCTVDRGALCTGADAFVNAASGGKSFAAGLASCNVATANVALCGYCPGTAHTGSCLASLDDGMVRTGPMTAGACTALPDLVLPGCGNTVPGGANNCSSANAKHQGDQCVTDIDCCPNDALICSDNVCVPNHD